MQDALVSVIIPTYNSAQTVLRAIDSVLQQSHRNVEVIVIDDGSIDNTRTVLNSFIQEKKIEYVYQPNRGCGSARNAGIGRARGRYAAFLDADDYWHPKKIQKQLGVFNEYKGCVLCYTDIFMITPEQSAHAPIHSFLGKPRSGNMNSFLSIHNMITLSSAMVPMDMLRKSGGFTEEYGLMMFADYHLWLRLAVHGTFHALQTPLTYYQARRQQSTDIKRSNHQKIMKMFYSLIAATPWSKYRLWYMLGWSIHFVKYGYYIVV